MNAGKRGLAVALVLLTLGASRAAQADGADEEAARNLFREGLALHAANNYAAALDKFRAAYARWKNPKILTNIGTDAWELGRYVEAAEAYDEFLTMAPADDPNRKDVEKALADVLAKIGTLQIEVTGGQASIKVDGVQIDPNRLARIRVKAGHHDVEATSSGSNVRQAVDVAAGTTVPLQFTLSASGNIAVPPGSGQPKPSEPEKKSRGSALPWIIGGVGVVGLGASAIVFSMRSGVVHTLEKKCIDDACPDDSEDEIDRANRLGIIGLATLGVGVACVGTAVYMLATGSKSSDEAPTKSSKPEVALSIAPSGAAGTMRFRF